MNSSFKILPPDALREIFELPVFEKHRLIVGGYPDFDSQQLVLFRGDGSNVIAPFSMFQPRAGCSPNFEDFEIIDFGNTIKLGEYEASVQAILIDLDPEYKVYAESNNILDIN
jgi:hypothetical protein